ncbi:peptidylprolyl isomerase [Adhaeretor mobilis]|uniref:peptidylprolyl isomerase n=1 Tax=Adhaeretor mobilis TaxID=1930276 RepID=A0A517MVH6_9BACT|nr:peptidylprolyl isomerase [Adhaeretor mobilis]QDS98879.1 Peptidyl-prolyl cis-trans isomerase A precursor [Adhaeretor mobilis]
MRKTTLLALAFALITAPATAQTLRFDTNVGSFNIVLNPTDNPNLQGHVDNFLGYVGLGRYHYSAINRAPEDFVIQMGGFSAFPGSSDTTSRPFQSIESGPQVVVDSDNNGTVDFDTSELSNTIGTISLALSNSTNSGTSSFFINLSDNSDSLDRFFVNEENFIEFLPFAEIQSIDSLDAITDLEQIDLSTALGSPGNLAFIDVPVVDETRFVVVQDVTIVEADEDFSFVGPIQRALGIENLASSSAAASALSSSSSSSAAVSGIPEPTAFCLALLAGAGLAGVRRRRAYH